MIGRSLTCAALVAGLSMLLCAPASAAGLRLGFTDLGTVQGDNPAERPLELQHLKATRATTVRLMYEWRDIEKAKPPSDAEARNPAWSGYDWSEVDATLRDIATAGVEPLVEVSRAPAWWEGAGRPAISPTAQTGTWRPDPAAFGRFMHAAASRYSGRYPDPLLPGRTLPRVSLWQAWNEPNLPNELTPQWTRAGSRYAPASPAHYKRLLNAAYTEIKRASPGATVIAAGTAPFGEPWPGGARMPPALFVRTLLCVDGRARPKARNCRRNPARFDILAHHPYPIGPPGRHAVNRDDVCIPDFAKLTKPLAVAVRAGNVFPKRRKPVWATEMSWDTNPPDPGGIEPLRQGRYAAGSMYVLWRQGVRALLWWNLRDDPGPNYRSTLQSGVFYRGATVALDTPKPSYTAFRFPFTAFNSRKRGALLWGIAPTRGAVTIQRQTGATWQNVKTVTPGAGRVFQTRLRSKRGDVLRATQAGEASIDARIF